MLVVELLLKINTVMNFILFIIYEPYILYLMIYSYIIDKIFHNLKNVYNLIAFHILCSIYLITFKTFLDKEILPVLQWMR